MYASSRRRKNIIIAILLIMVVGMAIAYSALSSQLKINGTSKTDGNLLVEFIDIQESAMIDASTVNKSYEGVTATFRVDLKKPGSYAEYELTVQNKGNIDVYLNDIKGLDEANDKEPYDITFALKDFYYDELLKAGETKKFKVAVDFDERSEELPSTSKDLTLELIYSQDVTGNHTPTLPGGGSADNILTNNIRFDIDAPIKNGLYALDENGELTTSSSNTIEYRYIGSNPNNYVLLDGELWRIVNLKKDRYGWISINKLIKYDSIGNLAWDSNGSNSFENSTLFNQMPSCNYCYNYIRVAGLGNIYTSSGTALTFENAEILEEIDNYYYNNKYELITPSDYGFAAAGGTTTSRSQCLSQPLASWNDPTYSDCINNNWLNFSDSYWTLTKNSDTTDSVFIKNTDGSISSNLVTENFDIYPVLSLTTEYYALIESGIGTIDNPYIIVLEPQEPM